MQGRHLLGIDGLTREQVVRYLSTAQGFIEVNRRTLKKVPTLRGRTVVHFFAEPSTRTQLSFDLAAKRLSADTVSLSASKSSLTKGESLVDTLRNIQAMRPDAIILRHYAAGACHLAAKTVDAAVINAGDGAHEHPTQALLDALTMLDWARRNAEEGLDGLHVGIVGDIAHSRVARSNIFALKLLGARVTVCGPRTLLQPGLQALGAERTENLDELLPAVDVCMMLRVQKERIVGGAYGSDREYHERFGLTTRRMQKLKPSAPILHPGPINRGVEIASEVADAERTRILQQAEFGVATRMAVLFLHLTQSSTVGDTP